MVGGGGMARVNRLASALVLHCIAIDLGAIVAAGFATFELALHGAARERDQLIGQFGRARAVRIYDEGVVVIECTE